MNRSLALERLGLANGPPRTVLDALVAHFRSRAATRILSVVQSRPGGVPHGLTG
jgi:hypothetical protein